MITREFARTSARLGAIVAVVLASSLTAAWARSGHDSNCPAPETGAKTDRSAPCAPETEANQAYLQWAVSTHRAALAQTRLPAAGSVRPAVLIREERAYPRAGACGACGPVLLP